MFVTSLTKICFLNKQLHHVFVQQTIHQVGQLGNTKNVHFLFAVCSIVYVALVWSLMHNVSL